jgi:uncharacterized repeat protein (TIGR02543 family)
MFDKKVVNKVVNAVIIVAMFACMIGCGGNSKPTQKPPTPPPPPPPVTWYTVNFNPNCDGIANIPSQMKQSGQTITEPNKLTCGYYDFDGWYSDSDLSNQVAFPYTVTANATLYANWLPTKYSELIPLAEDLAYEVAGMFYYWYPGMEGPINNQVVGDNEVFGTCGTYATQFVNIWNERYMDEFGEAFFVLQRQGWGNVGCFGECPPDPPADGFYRLIKHEGFFPATWGQYWWNGGWYTVDPEYGAYKYELVHKISVTSYPGYGDHYGSHAWGVVGMDISVDPTHADHGHKTLVMGIFDDTNTVWY